MILRYVNPLHYIFRVSGLFGIAGSSVKGYNFVDVMVRMAREGKDLKVVDDQVLTPTYTLDASRRILEVTGSGKYGTYHLTSTGECSWFRFTKEIVRQCGLKPASLLPVPTGTFGEKAVRPSYSVLDNARLRANGFEEMPDWKDALRRYLVEKGHLDP
jgi:dTDP-4-dehydrorhamnose reductase